MSALIDVVVAEDVGADEDDVVPQVGSYSIVVVDTYPGNA